jgi:hypothetical protein
MPAQKMHQYVLGWVGLFIAFAATFPIAMARVSQTEKFTGQAVKSLDCNGKSLKTRNVVSWKDTCSQMQVEPLKKTEAKKK